jgi:hypothetical protein
MPDGNPVSDVSVFEDSHKEGYSADHVEVQRYYG